MIFLIIFFSNQDGSDDTRRNYFTRLDPFRLWQISTDLVWWNNCDGYHLKFRFWTVLIRQKKIIKKKSLQSAHAILRNRLICDKKYEWKKRSAVHSLTFYWCFQIVISYLHKLYNITYMHFLEKLVPICCFHFFNFKSNLKI